VTAENLPEDVHRFVIERDTSATMTMQRDAILKSRRSRSGISGSVRKILLAQPGHLPNMEEVASVLCITSRTLRRQLHTEDTSYRILVDEVRETLAEKLILTNRVSMEEIAERLGYAEHSNFFHAFKRWKGITPIAFRQQRLSEKD